MDHRPINVKLAKGTDDDLAEALGPFRGTTVGAAGRLKNLARRGLGLPEPRPLLLLDEQALRRILEEVMNRA